MDGTMIGTIEVKVESSELKRQAYEVDRLATNLRQRFDSIEKLVKATDHHWIGEAGDLHRRLYNEQKEDLADALLRLKEHPKDLLMIAGIYDDAEGKNTEEVGTLRDDVII